jgi:hypothetical protein
VSRAARYYVRCGLTHPQSEVRIGAVQRLLRIQGQGRKDIMQLKLSRTFKKGLFLKSTHENHISLFGDSTAITAKRRDVL